MTLLSVLVALGLATQTDALRAHNSQQVALAQLYDPATGTYSDYYLSDDGQYASYIEASQDWSYYMGEMTYTPNGDDEDCGYHTYYYDSTGAGSSFYVSGDTEYEAYYNYATGELYEFTYNYYDEYVNDDGTAGSTTYVDADGVYTVSTQWSVDADGTYYSLYTDPDTSVAYTVDANWYYMLSENLLTGEQDVYYADYYNLYVDDDGTYTSEVYASPDWSVYEGSAYYNTDLEQIYYEFDSNGEDITYVASTDGHYSSYYNGFTGEFYEYIWVAPQDYYFQETSDDGMTYYYTFVDGDGCYSYEGTIYNDGYYGNVYLNENGHMTTYESKSDGCWNQYYDHNSEETLIYWPVVDFYYTSPDGNYIEAQYADPCEPSQDQYYTKTDSGDAWTEYYMVPTCDITYTEFYLNDVLCYQNTQDSCNNIFEEDYHETDYDFTLENDDGSTYSADFYSNCDGSVYYSWTQDADDWSIYEEESTNDPYTDTSYYELQNGYYFVYCDNTLEVEPCEVYYTDYYETGVLDNGYAWEYYLDPYGIPEFGFVYNPIGFEEDSEYGVYQEYYEFNSPDYETLYRQDTVGCYNDYYETLDGGATNYYYSFYNDEHVEYTSDDGNVYYTSYTDCLGDVWLVYTEIYSPETDEVQGNYYVAHSSGEDDHVDVSYYVYDDQYYDIVCDFTVDDLADQCVATYYDYYSEGQSDDGACFETYYLDADNVTGTNYIDCEYDNEWTTYVNIFPENDLDVYYYSETWDTWYHVWCFDAEGLDCEDQYDDYYDAGSVLYAEGGVYYWEVYALPDTLSYHGKHVHASLDGSSYSAYTFDEPEGEAFTYYETPTFASLYSYSTGAYTEWTQDFYGEWESGLFEWRAEAYMNDDSDIVDEFAGEMHAEDIDLNAWYDSLDNLIVEITTDKDAFYAKWTVGDEENADVEHGDSFESGENFDEFTGVTELWYTYYDIDGNQFQVSNYFTSGSDILGNDFLQVVDGQQIETYYQWTDNLSQDLIENVGLGYTETNSYTNSVYYENGAFSSYYILEDDGVNSYYVDEFQADDGTYRTTTGGADGWFTFYRSGDGYFESNYDWVLHTYTTTYFDTYINEIADDGNSGYYSYVDPSGNYWITGVWSDDNGALYSSWQDSYGQDMTQYSDDDVWSTYDGFTQTYASGTYDYYSITTNDEGVTTETYRSADGSIWSVEDSWVDAEGHEVTRQFTSDGTRVYSYRLDETHSYITDLNTGLVTITPETTGSFDPVQGVVEITINGVTTYMEVSIDEDNDSIDMEALNEVTGYLEAEVYRSQPWNTNAWDSVNNVDVTVVNALEFDTVVNGTYAALVDTGDFEADASDKWQSGEALLVWGGEAVSESEEVNPTGVEEVWDYVERTLESVQAEFDDQQTEEVAIEE